MAAEPETPESRIKELEKIQKNKDRIIKREYYDEGGYNSKEITLRKARKEDNTITKADVESWYDANVIKRGHAQGVTRNSFVAPHKGYEYQIDVFFIKDLETEQKYTDGFIMIDIFTRYAVVLPVKNRLGPTLKDAIEKGIEMMQMGQGVKKPEMIYADGEPAWTVGNIIKNYLEAEGIKMYITRNHGAFGERFIRTFKNMLYKRMDSINPEKRSDDHIQDHGGIDQWYSYIAQIMVTYNTILVHSSLGMTPKNASRESNAVDVKTHLELKAIKNRKYPELKIGDTVHIRRKRKTGEKERFAPWGELYHKVIDIQTELGQKVYTVDQDTRGRSYTRGELLKTS